MATDGERRAEYLRVYRQRYRAYLRERERERRATPEGRKAAAARLKRYRDKHRDKVLAGHRDYYQRNKHKRAVHRRGREDRMRHATPPWADLDAMKAIYDKAKAARKVVDHIIPLSGKLVCGLHVETNLQLLTPRANSKKSNKFTPYVTYA